MSIVVELPDLGESVVEGTVSNWLVKEGDRVRFGGRDLRWEYPRKELEARVKPAGAGAWSSTLDGVACYRSIELRANAAPVEGDEFNESVAAAVPQVVAILTGGNA